MARTRITPLLFTLVLACSSSDAAPVIPPAVITDDAGIPNGGPSPTRLDASGPDTSSSATGPIVDSTVACVLTGVHSVDVPAVHDSTTATRLRHRYRVFSAARPNAPTVVVVPGGPGGDIMQNSPDEPYATGAIPTDDLHVIYTDARGSGCNTYPKLAESSDAVYRIDEVSRDVAAVVRAEKLTDYILYGASFGTTVVTAAASLLEHDGGPAPKRLVLEGTLGRAFDSFDDYFAAFRTEWPRVKTLIHPTWRDELDKEPWSPTLFWSRDQWGMFVSEQLIIGDIPGSGHVLHYWLSGLSAQSTAAQQYVGAFMAAAANPASPGELFETIACRELWGDWRPGRELRNGNLEATGANLCSGGPKAEPWDSAAFQLSTPIVYVQGPFDPATTVAQAEYHFVHQTSVARRMITVPLAAHAPLTVGLQGRGCAKAVWKAIDAAPQSLASVLAGCTKPGDPVVTLKSAL